MGVNKNNRSLLSRWKSKSNKQTTVSSITKAPLDIDIPLSWGQQRLWFLQQLYPNNPFYNYCETYVFKGSIDADIFEQSIQEVFNNNAIFRSTYHVNNGELYQVVNDKKIPTTRIDLSQFGSTEKKLRKEELLRSEASKSFDLSVFPLVNTSIIKLSNEELILNLNMHHIITDKWSMGVFRKELSETYQSLLFGKQIHRQKELQYADYSYWQSNQKIDLVQLDYWKDRLSGEIPSLDLPYDFVRKANSSFNGAFDTYSLDQDLSKKILDLSKKFETTPFVLLFSAFNLLLFKYTRQNEILVGSPVSNRSEKALEQLIGFFNETIILRNALSNAMTFRDLVLQTKSITLEAFSNKDIPFDLLVKELKPLRSLSINPFFQVMFLFHSVPDTPNFGEGIEFEYDVQDLGISKFDLTLYVAEENGTLSTTFEYATDLFREATIKRFQKHFKLLLEHIVKDPNLPLGEINMLTENEKILINSNSAFSNTQYAGIHGLFTDQVAKHPQHIAAIFGEEYISYLELDKKSTQMAINLQKYTLGQNKFIGLCVERSIDMIVAIMGVLKAGCAYMPIDPDYPEQRIDFILNDANVEILLTNERLHSHMKSRAKLVATIDSLCVATKESHIDLPEPNENHYAYLIYTSGSSGQPKGVAITHKNIINSTLARTHFYKENPSSFLLMSSISFDSSKVGVFWTLCTGGKLVISNKRLEQDIDALIKTLQHNKVSHTLMLPTLYKLLLENSNEIVLHDLKIIIVAGEACNPSVAKLHFSQFPSKALYNEYGPTEATVWCIAHKINEDDVDGIIPIGKPVANAIVYLLDDSMNPVPFGATGEVYVGGPGVTNGYLNREGQTQEVFISNPFDDQETKLYKTGDLGRYRHDGAIEFIGRVDKQIKIRGYRIELQEIENIMLSSNMIEEVVLNIESTNSSLILGNKSPSHNELISLLMNHLNEDEINELIHSVESIHPEERSYLLELLDK